MTRILRYPQFKCKNKIAIIEIYIGLFSKHYDFMNHITWIRDSLARQRGKKTQAGLAAALHRTPAAVTRMLNEQRNLKASEIEIVAKYLEEEPPEENNKFSVKKPFDLHAEVVPHRNIQFGPDMVPVLGIANGSSEALVLNFDEPIGYVPRHPNQFGMDGSFSLYTKGESMAPRYNPGDAVYAIANKQPSKTQDCLIELDGGIAYLKQFIRQTEKFVICHQYNPDIEWKRALIDVKAIHAVVGRG